MNCAACGASVPEGAAFCASCGKPIVGYSIGGGSTATSPAVAARGAVFMHTGDVGNYAGYWLRVGAACRDGALVRLVASVSMGRGRRRLALFRFDGKLRGASDAWKESAGTLRDGPARAESELWPGDGTPLRETDLELYAIDRLPDGRLHGSKTGAARYDCGLPGDEKILSAHCRDFAELRRKFELS
jgi:hypothetical protein